jgi:hypothetical protein
MMGLLGWATPQVAGTSIILITQAGQELIFLNHGLSRDEVFSRGKYLVKKCHIWSKNG